MVDTARRFITVTVLKNIIDGLSFSKMSVLHLHLSDEPAIRFESKKYPELNTGLNGAYYSQVELTDLIAYAKDRGVRIIPELDVPAHAGGLKALIPKGLGYCSTKMGVLNADAKTLTLVDDLFGVDISHQSVTLMLLF